MFFFRCICSNNDILPKPAGDSCFPVYHSTYRRQWGVPIYPNPHGALHLCLLSLVVCNITSWEPVTCLCSSMEPGSLHIWYTLTNHDASTRGERGHRRSSPARLCSESGAPRTVLSVVLSLSSLVCD